MTPPRFARLPEKMADLQDIDRDRVTKKHQKMPSGCWEWTGSRNDRGYGQYWVTYRRKPKMFQAHRLSYFYATGEDPGELLVRHTCDNPPCVNPAHLLVGTHKDNTRDCIERGRRNDPPRRKFCANGHPYTPENTYTHVSKTGRVGRHCLACRPASWRRVQARRSAEIAAYRAVNPRLPVTHCKQGHEYSPDNTQIKPSGRRECRACDRARHRRSYHAARKTGTPK